MPRARTRLAPLWAILAIFYISPHDIIWRRETVIGYIMFSAHSSTLPCEDVIYALYGLQILLIFAQNISAIRRFYTTVSSSLKSWCGRFLKEIPRKLIIAERLQLLFTNKNIPQRKRYKNTDVHFPVKLQNTRRSGTKLHWLYYYNVSRKRTKAS